MRREPCEACQREPSPSSASEPVLLADGLTLLPTTSAFPFLAARPALLRFSAASHLFPFHAMIVPRHPALQAPDAFLMAELTQGWTLHEAATPDAEYLPVESVPTNVHLDLLAHKRIPDPFLDLNELTVQWVAERSWVYQCKFPASFGPGIRVDLLLEGLDTFATVYVNEHVVLTSDNMFVSHRVDITDHVSPTGLNRLVIKFESALLKARELQAACNDHRWICWNGEPARLAVRKAQYHWGWDWGPKLMTCGPWRPVRIETYRARIADLKVDIDLAKDLTQARIHISLDVVGRPAEGVILELWQNGKREAGRVVTLDAANAAQATLIVDNPRLWWPHGYGDQSLYEVVASIGTDGHETRRRVGIRNIELVQDRDKYGRSFFFRVNRVDVFGAGSNWIPADSFTPRITKDRYRQWLEMMVEGRQTVVRCWGGGIWEPDIFFDLCDELGILVWQDFLFACGNYPANPAMIASITAECETQLTRLRHHACLAVLAGNNEDYAVQEAEGLKYDFGDKDPSSWLRSDFPARYLYEKLLPDMVKKLSPSVAYHPGSPWSHGKPLSDPGYGDIHQWNVWHGTQEKYQNFDKLGGRFVSEFGMGSLPHRKTIEQFVTKLSEMYPQSRTLDFHDKATGGERRLTMYVMENLRIRHDLNSFIYLTQLVQSEAMSYAYKGWRKQWGDNRRVGGALCWQLNDCWPVTSWAICDYFLRKKPAYYAVKRALAPLAVSVQRDHYDWAEPHKTPPKSIGFSVWVTSSHQQPKDIMVELRFISTRTGMDVQDRATKSAVAAPNGTTEIVAGTLDNTGEPYVIAARLFQGRVVSRDWDWPQPLKYLSLEMRGVDVKIDAGQAWISANRPTKGLVLEEREGVTLSDNCIDVMPGDVQMITIKGLPEGEKLTWSYYDEPNINGPAHKKGGSADSAPPRSPTLKNPGSPSRRRGLTVRFHDDIDDKGVKNASSAVKFGKR